MAKVKVKNEKKKREKMLMEKDKRRKHKLSMIRRNLAQKRKMVEKKMNSRMVNQ
jgi:hypothetical protein